jgi:1,4-alpha-glucan branching enzyme
LKGERVSLPQDALAVKKAVYRSIRLAVAATGAKDVVVTGDFTGWTKEGVRLSPRGPGAWEATLVLAPGEYQYRLLVDGSWRDHPEAKRHVPNPFGTENCVLEVK